MPHTLLGVANTPCPPGGAPAIAQSRRKGTYRSALSLEGRAAFEAASADLDLADEIRLLRTLPVSLADVHVAPAYYHDYQEAIDLSIRADDELVAELGRHTPSILREKLSS